MANPTPNISDQAPQRRNEESDGSQDRENQQKNETAGRESEIEQRKKLLQIEHDKIIAGRRRQKKSSEEKNILEAEYLKNPRWDYQKKCDLALALNLTFGQVSKWNWDRRKKEEAQLKKAAKQNKQ